MFGIFPDFNKFEFYRQIFLCLQYQISQKSVHLEHRIYMRTERQTDEHYGGKRRLCEYDYSGIRHAVYHFSFLYFQPNFAALYA
jgi:hypothetical protein